MCDNDCSNGRQSVWTCRGSEGTAEEWSSSRHQASSNQMDCTHAGRPQQQSMYPHTHTHTHSTQYTVLVVGDRMGVGIGPQCEL